MKKPSYRVRVSINGRYAYTFVLPFKLTKTKEKTKA